ncbi:MAG TPA: hypothetical protein DCE44_11515 [Verrucomicrobiales bacterium]|nr:hypothetical protein [Verrucomicrobiales bacterium]
MHLAVSGWLRMNTSIMVAWLTGSTVLGATFTPVSQSFVQEIAHHFDRTNGLPAGPIQLIEVTTAGQPRAFTEGRWWKLADDVWSALPEVPASADSEFQFPGEDGRAQRATIPWRDVIQLIRFGATNYLVTAADPFQFSGGVLTTLNWPSRYEVRQLAVSSSGELWLASAAGLHRRTDRGWEPVRIADGLGRVWGAEDGRGVAVDARGRVWFATAAGVAVREGNAWKFFEGEDGLPWNDFTSVTAGGDGSVWFATRLGAIRFDGIEWQYRQGSRWLPNDHVEQVAVNARGDAWLATPGGLGWIERRTMTLAEKARFYEGEIDRYIRRTPYQYVSQAHLRRPGDRTSAESDDDDNDGLWTAMYGAGECFAWAATRDPEAKSRAKRAFEALRFLQEVTRGGNPAPPLGYVARSIRSVALPDPNVGGIERDREQRAQGDKLWKVYEPRWPKSADGAWFWKSDTSSDELDGHYFLYAQYFELCADTAEEKARVTEVVRALTDHLLANNYALVDVDGTPTRWAQYGPQVLNHDPYWWWERGLNSLSMLSYLAVAEHITGDPKYARAARELIDVHGYAQNAMVPKIQAGIGSGNQSDD